MTTTLGYANGELRQLGSIRSAVESRSDITLEELIEALNLPIKKSRPSLVLISMGFSFEKRLCTQKSGLEKMQSENAGIGRGGKKS